MKMQVVGVGRPRLRPRPRLQAVHRHPLLIAVGHPIAIDLIFSVELELSLGHNLVNVMLRISLARVPDST